MKRLSLTRRLSIVFAALLLACCGVSAWLHITADQRYQREVIQQLSSGLASYIADTVLMMDTGGKPTSLRSRFEQLIIVNPAVEVYLLDMAGTIQADASTSGTIQQTHVDLEPVHRFIAGEQLPIYGTDPHDANGRKVFSAAPLRVNGQEQGYIYVVLQGAAHDALASTLATSTVLHTTLWSIGLVALLGLIAGLVAFALITRPLRSLTQTVRSFDGTGTVAAKLLPGSNIRDQKGDEIAVLQRSFAQMGKRISQQWAELIQQDKQRRDLITNISHDLRTPLTRLHGYLETLHYKDSTLSPAERRHYMDIALGQSNKVNNLAQELFELARLESGLVELDLEAFPLPELVQDVVMKFEPRAVQSQQSLHTNFPPGLPPVLADMCMIERVLSNLLDNAIQHNPPGTKIHVQLQQIGHAVAVRVSDTGSGIPPNIRQGLFKRDPHTQSDGRDSGGLGLVIVQRILQLHQSQIVLIDEFEQGAIFQFELPIAS